jgi:negative regulator of replication initiation
MAQQLGVRYRYGASQYRSEGEENSSVLSQLSRLQLDEIAVALAAMPPEWVEQLHQAAIRVNAKQILLLVEQIPQSVPHLANALTYLVNNFRFEEIITLTQQQ